MVSKIFLPQIFIANTVSIDVYFIRQRDGVFQIWRGCSHLLKHTVIDLNNSNGRELRGAIYIFAGNIHCIENGVFPLSG